MDAILLVGGFGTRLMPLTKTRPKPLIPLVNVPFVERTIQWLRDGGVDHVILSVHYNAEQFMRHFSRLRLDVDISFASESTPLGTGGAIKNCEPFLRSPRCFVFNGDIFTSLDLTRMLHAHQRANALMSIALHEVEDPSRFGVIETNADNRIQSFIEKPPRALARSRDINAGVYIFERAAFAAFPSGPCSVEREVFPRLVEDGALLYGYRAWPYWTDLGTPTDYLQAHQDILSRKVNMPLQYREVTPGIWLGEQLSIADTALIRPPVVLGDGVCIDDGATVGPHAVLGRRVHIEPRALVEQSVLWDDATVRRDSVVRQSILGRCSEAHGQVLAQVCGDYGVNKG